MHISALILAFTLLSCVPNTAKPDEKPNPLKELVLESPSGVLSLEIFVDNTIEYRVSRNGAAITELQPLSLSLEDGKVWGRYCTLKDTRLSEVDETIDSPFFIKKKVEDRYNGARYIFEEGFEVEFRVYDDACAYRFRKTGEEEITVKSEEVRFKFSSPFTMVSAPSPGGTGSDAENACNCFESYYLSNITDYPDKRLGLLPVYVKTAGQTVCLVEANVRNYPGMFIKKGLGNLLYGYHSPCVINSQRNEYQVKVPNSWQDYTAKCEGRMDLPWRIMMFPERDTDLLCSDIIYRLAPERQLSDISWIKPGMSIWDWETSFTLDNVDFPSGRNYETYKYAIDYAESMDIPYITIDAECLAANGTSFSYASYMPKVLNYAKLRGVRVIVWIEAAWLSDLLEKGEKAAFDNFFSTLSADGVSGIKVDFFERADQDYINLQWSIASACAENHLVVSFHSTPIPSGMNRAYPNVLTYEAVRGLEHMKYGNYDVVSASGPADQVEYEVTFPYLRGFTGPVDYTPGLMRNASKSSWYANDPRPISFGTRCRQLASFVLFHSGIGTMADNVTSYEKESECAAFIASIPCEWDRSLALAGEIGQYLVMARQKGDEWFVAGLSNWSRRSLDIDLSFLDNSEWTIELFEDYGSEQNYKRSVSTLYESSLKITMNAGGAFAARIYKKQ